MKSDVKKKTRAAKSRELTQPPGSSPGTAAAGGRDDKAKESGSRWTFLTNHSHVLIVLHAEPDLVLREVAARVGITERAVQRVVQDLEEEGFIRRERVGRQNRYEVRTDVPLRHPIESHRTIGDLLQLITG
ncbi:MarR family protein [Stieleria maiorica]|uniref:MarR family protein n=1 Tax=Stieleria maiorica TaxID=2795974 RepID=A0A5B9M4I7_9BACT|nr:winged helix-turn-helix domain-containing protein [Stieleria maiorica]QEF96041.1 MarR family protein [Stieleria maiorica]